VTRVTVGSAGVAAEVRDLPEHLSYSQITMLHPHYRYACARKWAYRYRLDLADERSPSLAVGSAFDEAANAFFAARMAGKDAIEAGAKGLEAGIERFALEDEAVFASRRGEARQEYEDVFVSAFAAFTNAEGLADVATIQDRHTFTIRLDDRHVMPVVGYSDRVDRDGTLVDHKFSGSPRWEREEDGKPLQWHEEWVAERRDQLLIYWLARNAEEQRTGRPLEPPLNGRGRLVVTYHKRTLLKPQVRVCELELSLEAGRELLERAGLAARIAQDGIYPARPGPACGFCSYLGRCRDDEAARGRPFFELIDPQDPPF
jgi:PD-(D/E)XK nuclease superfamily